MSFEEELPGLFNDPEQLELRFASSEDARKCTELVMKHCLDKQIVREAIDEMLDEFHPSNQGLKERLRLDKEGSE